MIVEFIFKSVVVLFFKIYFFAYRNLRIDPMNFIVTTSEYIVRFKDAMLARLGNMINPANHPHPDLILARANNAVFTEETALHMLLDQGKTYREAELVIATLKEWGLPLEQVSYLDFEIHGTSVWIKPD
jgi:hypothetical protein